MKNINKKYEALILGAIVLIVGTVWFFIDLHRYDGYQPVEAYVTTTFYYKARKGRSSSTAFVTYTVNGTEYKSKVNMHCGQSALKAYEKTNIQIYYDPAHPAKAASQKDKSSFPVTKLLIALSGAALIGIGVVMHIRQKRGY